jgi:hypothetical protein
MRTGYDVKRLGLVCLLVLVLASAAFSQDEDTVITQSTGEDSLVIAPPPKRWDIAAIEVAALNVGTWAFGHYILDGYWTQISLNTMDLNLRHGFEWDGNQFKNNYSSHPYHGNTYFNSARTNGMNFWESVPFAFTGSLTWELFMESEFPSYGDLVMTTLGGAALGEELYRLSEQLLDDRATGSGRVWREIGALALNPIGGLNRLLRGDMFKTLSATNHIRNPLNGYVALGTRTASSGGGVNDRGFNPALSFSLFYGDPFDDKSSRKPYDMFSFRFWTSAADSTRNVSAIQQGVLAGKNYVAGKNDDIHHLFGLFQHYDYVNVDLFNFGGVTLAPGIMSKWSLGGPWGLRTGAHFGWLILGGSNNEYFTNAQGRNYNYTQGVKGRAHGTLSHQKFGDLLADFHYFWMTSLEGIEGTDNIAFLNAVYNKKIIKNWGLGLEYFLYDRIGNYDGFPRSHVTISAGRILVTFGFY